MDSRTREKGPRVWARLGGLLAAQIDILTSMTSTDWPNAFESFDSVHLLQICFFRCSVLTMARIPRLEQSRGTTGVREVLALERQLEERDVMECVEVFLPVSSGWPVESRLASRRRVVLLPPPLSVWSDAGFENVVNLLSQGLEICGGTCSPNSVHKRNVNQACSAY